MDWKLLLGVVVATLLAVSAVVALWQWSEHKAAYYQNQMQKSLSDYDFIRANEFARKAEKAGVNGLQNEVLYQEACYLLEQGAYLNAQETFLELGLYKDSTERVTECVLRLATEAEEREQFTEASALYLKAGQSDAARHGYQRCQYALALQANEEDHLQEALHLFWEIKNYSDAYDRALAIAFALTGIENEEEALRLARGYTKEEWLHVEELKAAKERISVHTIAAGWEHGLILQPNGTVLAYGGNAYGETEVSAWTDVTAVAAGAYHSLALRADGTVLATGDNSQGQCNVSEWKHVISITCGPWDSFGITKDGKVLHCGYADESVLTTLQNVEQLEAGNASWAVLLENGSLVCSVPSGTKDTWKECADVAVGLGWTSVLFEDGTMDCTDYDLSEWTDVLEVSASSTLLVGIRFDGTLLTQVLMPDGQALAEALSACETAKGIALSSHWAFVLHWDDSIELLGDPNFTME